MPARRATLPWILLAACSGDAEPSAATGADHLRTARDHVIERYAQLDCPLHHTRMGLASDSRSWSESEGLFALDDIVGEPPYRADRKDTPVLPRSACEVLGEGRTWFPVCFACATEQPGPPRGIPRHLRAVFSDAPWKVWRNLRCPLHDLRVTPVVTREYVFDTLHWVRTDAVELYPCAGRLGVSLFEVPVEGSARRWAASCPECESVGEQHSLDALGGGPY